MKNYVDKGLERDASAVAAGNTGNAAMPEFQKLIATAGKSLQR